MNTSTNPESPSEEKRSVPPLRRIGPVAATLIILRLPLVAIVTILLRVALTLLRPVLLILGVIKACDLIRKASDKR